MLYIVKEQAFIGGITMSVFVSGIEAFSFIEAKQLLAEIVTSKGGVIEEDSETELCFSLPNSSGEMKDEPLSMLTSANITYPPIPTYREAEPCLFSIVLERVLDKVNTAKTLRQIISGLKLTEAIHIIKRANNNENPIIVDGVTKEKVGEIVERLTKAGAKAKIERCL